MNWTTTSSILAPSNSVNLEEHLLKVLGPVRLDLNWLVPLTGFYCIIFMTGIIGNTCTCLVIARNQYMQTATNCYLFNLAVADMLSLVCGMPLELYSLWHQYPWQLGTLVCELKALISEATAYASILTIVTFSTERYIAICHPIRQQTKSKLGRSVRNITIIWIISLLGATPYAVFNQVNYLNFDEGGIISQSAWCGFPFNAPDHSWETLMLCSTFLFFIVPMTIIIVLYALIAVTLRESSSIQRSTSESRATCRTDSERYKCQSRRIVVRMLVAVVVAFFLCWAPFHSQRLLFLYVTLYGEWTDILKKINQDLYLLAGCFYYSNSTINPILYSVMSNRFRVAFREKLCTGKPGFWCLFCCCCCLCKQFTGPVENEKRSQNRVSVYRNSHSQSSVKSQVTYPANNTVRNANNSFQRGSSSVSARSPVGNASGVIDHSDSFPITNVSWTRNPHYESVSLDNEISADKRTNIRSQDQHTNNGRRRHHSSEPNFNTRLVYKKNNVSVTTLNAKPNNIEIEAEILYSSQDIQDNLFLQKDEEELVLAQELEQIIGPEIAKMVGEKEGAGCLNCTNCNLLFHTSGKSGKRASIHKQEYLPVDDMDVSQVESSNSRGLEKSSSNTTESCV